VSGVDPWPSVRHRRCEFADEVESLKPDQWEAPSWCKGWRVRDVLGHLVYLAEATQVSILKDLLRAGGRPDHFVDRTARRLGDEPVSSLTSRLRGAADGRYHALGSPPAVALGDVLVHSADALRPLGLAMEPQPDEVAIVLPIYRRLGRLAFHAAVPRSVRLVATDIDWQSGQGPEIRGKGFDLLLLLANRRQVVSELEGPGLSSLKPQI
jgi:uncharacterized protein (TIGR03083 family)